MKQFKLFTLVLIVSMMSVGFSACSNDDDNNGSASAIVGKWVTSYYDDYGKVESMMTFGADGRGTISETFTDDPSENYSVVFNYTVEGDLSEGATLKVWGKDADGYGVKITYTATISGSQLTLVMVSHLEEDEIGSGIYEEYDGDLLQGDTIVLQRK